MLDYVSRAHQIEFVHRPSSVSQLSLNLMHQFLSNLGCCFPRTIWSDVFWIFDFFYLLRILFIFVNMGPYGSENFKTPLPQIAAKSIQTFPQLSPQWSSQHFVWDFWNFKNWTFNEFYSFPSTWDPMGVKISKRNSYKSEPKVLKLVLKFPPNGPHETTFGIFEILRLWFLTIFFENLKFTIVAYGTI